MRAVNANGLTLHVSESGDPNGPAVVFANSLGTDLRLWDRLLPFLPSELRYVRFDLRGHGLSECPTEPYSLGDLTADAEGLMTALGLTQATFVGLSVGGMIGQLLALRRPDLLSALVLSNTASQMGTPEMWQNRISAIKTDGLPAMQDGILDRWFGPTYRGSVDAQLWGAMLSRTPKEGYLGCCAAIAQADLRDSTAALHLPVLAIGGSEDGASPPDLVKTMAGSIANASCQIIDGVGHLPCVENPEAFADVLVPFLKEHANV